MKTQVIDMKKKITSIIILLLFVVSMVCGCQKQQEPVKDSVKFEGDNYILLEYPANLLFYDIDQNISCEEDEICPVESPQWPMVYHEGDLYCKEENIEEAEQYYADESNYEWSLIIESEDVKTTCPIEMTDEAIQYLYDLDAAKKEEAIFFEEIEMMATLKKVSKDGVVQARTELAYYNYDWYCRTETIDEDREEDGTWPEYIQKLPSDLFSLPIGE